MAFHPVSHGIEVVLHFQQDGQELVNTIGFYADLASPTLAEVIAANAIVTGDFLTDYQLLQSNTCRFYKSVSTALDRADGPQFILEAVSYGAISASQPLPLSVAALVSTKSAIRGKGETGHIYLTGLTESSTSGDDLEGGFIDDMTTALNLLPLAPTADGIQWGFISHRRLEAYPVTGFSLRPTVAVQKLRLPGRKRRRHIV